MRPQIHTLLLITLAALFLTACGGGKPEPANITIELTEYQFSPNYIELQVGQEVTLTLVNKGALEHELMIGRQVHMVDNIPAGYQIDMFEQAGMEPMVMQAEHTDDHEDDGHTHANGDEGHADHMGFMVTVPTGDEEATVTFTVTEDMVGEWEMGCFLLDGVHYQSGMKGKLVVKPR
jgi:plastocyanin